MPQPREMSDFTRQVFDSAKMATSAAAANYARVRGTETKRTVTARHFTVRQSSSPSTAIRKQHP